MTILNEEDFKNLLQSMIDPNPISEEYYLRSQEVYKETQYKSAYTAFCDHLRKQGRDPMTELSNGSKYDALSQWSWFYAGWCKHRECGI